MDRLENGSMTLFLFLYIYKKKAYLYETLYTWEWNIGLHFFFYAFKKKKKVDHMKLYKLENGSKILFFFLYIQNQIGGPLWEFIDTWTEHWIFFSSYIHTKTNRQNVRRIIELGVGIIEFFFWLEGFDIMKFKKLDWSIIMASFKFYKTWTFMKLNKNSKFTIKT